VCHLKKSPRDSLKGLGHQIDFKYFDKKKLTDPALNKGRGWCLNFLGPPLVLYLNKKYFFRSINAHLYWLDNVGGVPKAHFLLLLIGLLDWKICRRQMQREINNVYIAPLIEALAGKPINFFHELIILHLWLVMVDKSKPLT
jgi:hypothetical protein